MSWWQRLLAWLRGDRPPVPIPPEPPPPGETVPAALLRLHNLERTQVGRSPLQANLQLQTAAQGHANHMAQVRILAHAGIGDGDMNDRLIEVGYHYLSAAENVALGQPTPASVVPYWMTSSGHKANILGPYRDFGGAVAWDDRGTSYWCTTFGMPG